MEKILNCYYNSNSNKEESGIVLGEYNREAVIDYSCDSVLLNGPCHSGKSVSSVMPTLLKYWKSSAVIIDIKGENYQLTSGTRKQDLNNIILRFAPKDIHSCSYNPLSEIRLFSENQLYDIQKIVNISMENYIEENKEKKDLINNVKDFLNGVIAYVSYKEFLEKNTFITNKRTLLKEPITNSTFNDVINFINECSENLKIEYILNKSNELSDYEKELIYLIEYSFNKFYIKNNLEEIIDACREILKIYSLPIVKRNTMKSDFRITDLMNHNEPISLYITILPFALYEMKSLYKLLITQIIDKSVIEFEFGKPFYKNKNKLLFLFDEFSALGKIDILEEKGKIAKLNDMKLFYIIQTMDQLYKIYGKNSDILNHTLTKICFQTTSITDIKYIYNKINKNQKMSVDKIARFDFAKMFLFTKENNVVFLNKILYFKDKNYENLNKKRIIYTESIYDENKKYFDFNKKYSYYDLIKNEKINNYNYLPSLYAQQLLINELEELIKIYNSCSKKNDNKFKENTKNMIVKLINYINKVKEIFEKINIKNEFQNIDFDLINPIL